MMLAHRVTLLLLAFATFTTGSAASAADGEWAQCPSVGVATRIDPLLKSGRLLCTYMHSSRSEVLSTRTVSSSSGKSFRSCLRDNRAYDQKNGRFASRAFCSTTLTQDQLNKSAYTWAKWTGSNKKLKRVRLGQTNKNGEFYVCRVKDGGYTLGQVVGAHCSYYARKAVRLTTKFDHLLLTKDYGVPTAFPRDKTSTIWLDPGFKGPEAMAPRLCTTNISPSAFDFNGIVGSLPGARTGPMCLSHSGGKLFFAKNRPEGTLAGLE